MKVLGINSSARKDGNTAKFRQKAGNKMKKKICIMLSFLLFFIMAGCGSEEAENETENQELSKVVSEPEQKSDMETKTLVVYFSATGTTKQLADYVAEILNADLYEIVPENLYTEADLAYYTNGRADQEQDDVSARPGIAGSVENMEGYDTIILGYPIWLAYHNLIQCTQA